MPFSAVKWTSIKDLCQISKVLLIMNSITKSLRVRFRCSIRSKNCLFKHVLAFSRFYAVIYLDFSRAIDRQFEGIFDSNNSCPTIPVFPHTHVKNVFPAPHITLANCYHRIGKSLKYLVQLGGRVWGFKGQSGIYEKHCCIFLLGTTSGFLL